MEIPTVAQLRPPWDPAPQWGPVVGPNARRLPSPSPAENQRRRVPRFHPGPGQPLVRSTDRNHAVSTDDNWDGLYFLGYTCIYALYRDILCFFF